VAQVINTKNRGKLKLTKFLDRKRLSQQEPIEVSQGLMVEARSGGRCERCGGPYQAGATVALLNPARP
jgi:hypothetical protein